MPFLALYVAGYFSSFSLSTTFHLARDFSDLDSCSEHFPSYNTHNSQELFSFLYISLLLSPSLTHKDFEGRALIISFFFF
jgi:hypothetical protein